MTNETTDGNSEWGSCQHEWRVLTDSMWHNEVEEEVVCIHCGCPGMQDIETGEVTWPTT